MVAALSFRFSVGLALIAASIASASATFAADKIEIVAQEAVNAAIALPPSNKRDLVLRAVSRNLRWFGRPEEGMRAARAMTDAGLSELPRGTTSEAPRYVPLREALPTGSPCDAGLWSEESGSKAKTPHDREAWAQVCLLKRDFHWIGLPRVDHVRAAATGLPAGKVKGAVLAMLLRDYRDDDTLRFVNDEVSRDDLLLPKDVRDGLRKMLAAPAVLYRLGLRGEALAAARMSDSFASRAEFVRLLVAAGDAETAATIFELLADTPPEFAEGCESWFDMSFGLGVSGLGNAWEPVPSIGTFLDLLPASSLFRRICPNGLDAEPAVEHLLAAGQFDAAIRMARRETAKPFLLIDTLLQVGRVKLRSGDRDGARALVEEAATVLPPFDPGDPMEASDISRTEVSMSGPTEAMVQRNRGEREGDTRRRFEVIQMLAASGASTEADELARKQPSSLRAVALSAAVAGRAGLRFDDQAPSLTVISATDL